MKATVAGIPIEIVSGQECEKADWWVCVPWSTPARFPNDIRGTCCACGMAVRHRPYAPKKPPKICVRCVVGVVRPN